MRGEGMFLELDEEAVAAWESAPGGARRAAELLRRATTRGRRRVETAPRSPGARFYLLHSLSHLLSPRSPSSAATRPARSASASTARPRRCDAPMAAILLSTGTTGTEGTLGGLVEQGRRLATTCAAPGTSASSARTTRCARRHSPRDDRSRAPPRGRRLPRLPLHRRVLLRAVQPLPRPRARGADHRAPGSCASFAERP